ncbi:MAG: M28 family peptidase, partial [Gemmatimonadetes bacterium]|nr:M28 family peptidase [Gemmatimonadota bacterium]NIT85912.1 M28 family peptidase [Gemmatimonadota bacterium]NIU29738.1 M28 family peptidase [Gemmatimonadota bacterium]NIV60146.1 M28 family peptidase [Gemmatimonadota bacterium]NIW62803.1 M28 family peptidase [Gemmatimonadota bacterium]
MRAAAQGGSSFARVEAQVEPALSDARNVVAVHPGSDPALAREVVILGAHYDHLGYGGAGSLAPGVM